MAKAKAKPADAHGQESGFRSTPVVATETSAPMISVLFAIWFVNLAMLPLIIAGGILENIGE